MGEINNVDIGLGILGSGLALSAAYPSVVSSIALPILSVGAPVALCGVGAAGGIYGIYRVLTKDKRIQKENYKYNCEIWELFWSNNKIICNGTCPKFAYDILDGLKRTIMFELPFGIYKSDIEKVSDRIKEMLEVDNMKINIKDNKLYLNISTLSQQQKDWMDFWEYSDIKSRGGEYPELIDIKETNYGYIYKFKSTIGLSTYHLKNIDVAIKEFIGYDDISFKIKDGYLYIDVLTRELPENAPYSLDIDKFLNELIIEIGLDKKGETVYLNLDTNPNLLIAGCTGSGKSVCTNLILTQLLCRRKDIKFYLIDLKRTEFGMYKKCKNVIKYTKDKDEAWDFIKELIQECDRRSDLFEKVNAKNLSDYNKRVSKDKQLNRIVLAIDDAVRLISNGNLQKDLAELGFLCRSAGITVLCNIQRPSAKLMSPDFKASLTNVIGFKAVNGSNSKIICDDTCLSKLNGRGHGILFNDECENGKIEFKGFYLSDKDMEDYLNKYCEFNK